jgi:hypothetical protein
MKHGQGLEQDVFMYFGCRRLIHTGRDVVWCTVRNESQYHTNTSNQLWRALRLLDLVFCATAGAAEGWELEFPVP